MNWFNTIVVVGIAIIFLPVLAVGGLGFALVLAVGWLILTFGSRLGFDVFKERQSGATAAKHKARSITRERDNGQRWDR